MSAAAQEYLAARVMTASPQALHLLVVEGALRHARRAEEAFEAADREAAHAALNKARSFVTELIGGLNPEHSPEIASNTASLFTFAYRRLVEADVYGSADHVRDAAKVLRIHRETWRELLEQSAEPAATQAGPAQTGEGVVEARHPLRRMPAEYDDYQPRSWCG